MPELILRSLQELSGFKQAASISRQGGCAAIYDAPSSLRLLLALALATEQPMVYLLPSERAARQAMEDATGLGFASRCAFLPARETRFLRAVSSKDIGLLRLRALESLYNGQTRLLIASIESLQESLMPPAWFAGQVIDLKVGDSQKITELTKALVQVGYERVDLVEGRGQFALRGDILDVFSPSFDLPSRVEFFDITVDSIRSFDPLTQRSLEQATGLCITPADEMQVPHGLRQQAAGRLFLALADQTDQDTGSRALLQKALGSQLITQADVQHLLDEGNMDNSAMWAQLIFPQNASILDWLPGSPVLLDSPDLASQRLMENQRAYQVLFTQALEDGQAHLAQQTLLRSPQEALDLLKGHGVLLLQDLLRGQAGFSPSYVFQLSARATENYRGRLPDLADQLKTWQEEGILSVLYTGGQARSERLAAALASQGMSLKAFEGLIQTNNGNLSQGFVCEQASLCLLAPGDLFAASRQASRKVKTAGQRIEAFSDLSIGDYVVHEHHGIGIYQGTVRLQSENIWRDYLYIQYRGVDKLYVPTDQFDRVQKYIGKQDAPPPLNDLSSNTWIKQKNKVRAGLKQLAFNLVQLYAKRQSIPGFSFQASETFEAQFSDQFEYELTPDQEQAVQQVLADMEKPQNMDRLLCGDVGYGKTEVAMRAAFRAIMNNKQVALLAPTTILVQQHLRTFSKRFEGFPVRIEMVSRFKSPAKNRETIKEAKEGKVDILIGTHRLLSRDVGFHNLGLLIIDEEQRFGVRHKEQIQHLKEEVDVLALSATPIPRTLHMSMVGVRDMSLLETPPEERYPVMSFVVDYHESIIRDAVMRELNRHGQVFYLYNRVADIERMAARLRQLVPEARVAIAHGQMPENALEDVMLDFHAGKHDVLLCSTIIENGLDIQNANTLIVHDADHFGLSQLYQLRGRVGRSNRTAYAFFTVKADKMISETAQKRLAAIKEFTAFGAGFRIALRDLEIRGAGNIFGPEQSGQVAAVGYDMYVKLIEEAIQDAQGSQENRNDLETRVDLQVNAFLPEGYVKGEGQRIEMYKRIAMVDSQQAEEELIDEMIDRFGEPGEEVINLMRIARLRALAHGLGADLVRYDRDRLLLRLHPDYAVSPEKLFLALNLGQGRLGLQAGRQPSLYLMLPSVDSPGFLPGAITLLEALHQQLQKLSQEAEGQAAAVALE